MKIRNKLTYQFAVIVATILIIFSGFIYFFSATYRKQEFDKRLIDKGLTTARLLIKVDEVDMKLLRIIDRNNLTALTNEKITVYDSLNTKIYSSDDDPEIPVDKELFNVIKQKKEVFFMNGDNQAVGILYTERNNKVFIIVSAYDKFGLNKLRNLKLILIVGFLLAVGAIFLTGWVFSGQAIRPISEIVKDVKQISVTNLNSRIDEGNGQDEIAQLAIQFNKMLSRLEAAFEMQKTFVSNSSHELRTPLSTIRTQIEVSLSNNRSEEEYRKVLNSLADDINNLIKLSNGLLELAQIGTDLSLTRLKKIRIDELIFQAVSDVNKRFSGNQININIADEIDEERMFIIMGNEQLLKTAFTNLIDNACKFSAGKSVDIKIKFLSGQIVISIVDQGMGIKPAELEHIFDPFYRGTNARNIMGHGIGLSLAKKIIEIHKGNIDIKSKMKTGTAVEVFLPIT